MYYWFDSTQYHLNTVFHSSLYSEEDFPSGRWNVSHQQQQSYSQGYTHPNDHIAHSTTTPGFKSFTLNWSTNRQYDFHTTYQV